jgi:hypothetical protein
MLFTSQWIKENQTQQLQQQAYDLLVLQIRLALATPTTRQPSETSGIYSDAYDKHSNCSRDTVDGAEGQKHDSHWTLTKWLELTNQLTP